MLFSFSHLLTNEKGASVAAVNVAVAIKTTLTDEPVSTTRGVSAQTILEAVGPVVMSVAGVTVLT
jgi:hypothetical protein